MAALRTGAAIHSVRAVPAGALSDVVAASGGRPLHVHLSEQPAENQACLVTGGAPAGFRLYANEAGPVQGPVADVGDECEPPLDRHRDWYRYHHLFRELLRDELARAHPEVVPELQRRASAWHREHGPPAQRVRRIVFEGSLALPENDLRRMIVERHGASPSFARSAQAVHRRRATPMTPRAA